MLKQIIRIVSDGLVYICLALSTIIEVILFSMPIERMNILQHIITYASCNLALVGFIFSLMLGLKGGTIYTQLIKRYQNVAKKIYRRIFYVSCASSFSALLSIAAIAFEKVIAHEIKYIVAFILIYVFIYMVFGTLSILGILVELMIDEFPRIKDNGHI